MHHRKGKPYIRRAHAADKSESIRVAFRMAYLQEMYGDYYVLVQHGFHNFVLAAARTKEELRQSILVVGMGRSTFKQWQREIHADSGLGKHANRGEGSDDAQVVRKA